MTKQRNVGASRDDLIDIYVLLIRSVAEYCSVTQEQNLNLERIQMTCLKVLLGEECSDYQRIKKMKDYSPQFLR